MSTIGQFKLTGPLPGRNAFEVLRRQLIDFIRQNQIEPGTPFLSDHDLVRATGLSRNTVRKSLDLLSKESWIERRHGVGTFVGPRATEAQRDASDPFGSQKTLQRADSHRLVKVAVMLGFRWYSVEVLRGLELAAVSERLSLDVIGYGTDPDHVRRRLELSRPDVLACLSPEQTWGLTIAEVRAKGTPVLVTGSRLAGMGIPTIRDDGRQGAHLAVRHLVEQGHRRIAFLQDTVPALWAFERYHGFCEAMVAAGLDPDDGSVLWLDGEAPVAETGQRIARLLGRYRPTALLLGSAQLMPSVAWATNERGIAIPKDLSLITFDQAQAALSLLPGHRVTVVALPLEETGSLLARWARAAADGHPPTESTILPCRLTEGSTVRPLR